MSLLRSQQESEVDLQIKVLSFTNPAGLRAPFRAQPQSSVRSWRKHLLGALASQGWQPGGGHDLRLTSAAQTSQALSYSL